MNNFLTLPYTALEVKEVVFRLGPTKAPTPDGIPALFYQKHWEIVGEDIIKASLHFLSNRSLLNQLTKPSVSLSQR